MGVFGGTRLPPRLISATSTPAGRFPLVGQTYTSPDGSVVVPHGWGGTWWNYSQAESGTRRGEVICYGDSTMFGAGPTPSFSWLQRIRMRAIGAGYTDGGKGFAGYDDGVFTYSEHPTEVSAFVSTTFTGGTDFHGSMTSMYFDDGSGANHVINFQFRGSAVRLWYNKRSTNGNFTYSLDGAAPVTVNGFTAGSEGNQFVYLSGLNPAVTHTLQVKNTDLGKHVYVSIDPLFDTGLVWQKDAQTGMTFSSMFFGGLPDPPFTGPQEGTWYQYQMGLVPTSVGSPLYAGATVDTTYTTAARIKPVLAITELGFNDLSGLSDVDHPTTYWQEYVRRFAGACRSAGVAGLVLSGNLPYNAQWTTWGPARFNMLKSEALAQGLAFADLFVPVNGPSLSYAGGPTNPHLSRTEYEAQADWLWDNLLGLY